MIKQRFLDAGVEEHLWSSQFGFRAGCSTEDAIYVARRLIEFARARKHGKITLVALDCAKAFDIVYVGSVLTCCHDLVNHLASSV